MIPDRDQIHDHNLSLLEAHRHRYRACAEECRRRGADPEALVESMRGIQFALSPQLFSASTSEVFFENCACVHRLSRQAARVAVPAPWQLLFEDADWARRFADAKLQIEPAANEASAAAPPLWDGPSLFRAFLASRNAYPRGTVALPELPRPLEPQARVDSVAFCLACIHTATTAWLQAMLVHAPDPTRASADVDPLLRRVILEDALHTDVRPLAAEYRLRTGAALDPFGAWRAFGRGVSASSPSP